MTIPIPMTIIIPPYQFHYQALGDSHLPPLVLLHGFLGCGEDFQTMMEYWAQDFYCLAPDLPGHGQSRSLDPLYPPAYGMEAVGNLLVQWLTLLRLESCYLLGYSLGGRLALYLLLHYPQWFKAGILVSASPGLADVQERSRRRWDDRQVAQRLMTTPLPEFLRDWYAQPLFGSLNQHPGFPDLFQRRLRNDRQQLARCLEDMGLGSQPNLWPHLAQLRCPLLCVVGEQDTKFQMINRAMGHQSSWITLKTIASASHVPQMEQPQEFAQVVRTFLTSHASSP